MLDALTSTAVPVRITPLHDRVLVLPDPDITEKGGVILPDTSTMEKTRPKEGTVVAVGAGKPLFDAVRGGWVREPIDVVPGDKIKFSPNAGSDFTIGDTEYLLLHQRDIFAIVYRDE
jgi:chaperonin GroES